MTKLEDIEITVRTYNVLKRAQINTVDELRAIPYKELFNIRNFGFVCGNEVKEILAKYPAKVTNFERIKAMSVEEMAKHHARITMDCEDCKIRLFCQKLQQEVRKHDTFGLNCVDVFQKWLEMEGAE